MKLDPSFMLAIKERIEISEQTKRYAKLMQQAYLAARGKIALTKSQAEAARTFMLGYKTTLGRFVPELKAMEVTGDLVVRNESELTNEELVRIATNGRGGTTEATQREPEPGGVH